MLKYRIYTSICDTYYVYNHLSNKQTSAGSTRAEIVFHVKPLQNYCDRHNKRSDNAYSRQEEKWNSSTKERKRFTNVMYFQRLWHELES